MPEMINVNTEREIRQWKSAENDGREENFNEEEWEMAAGTSGRGESKEETGKSANEVQSSESITKNKASRLWGLLEVVLSADRSLRWK